LRLVSGRAERCDHGHLVANKIGCHGRQSIVLTVGPPVLDLDGLAVLVTRLA
jgi:hypothetical protein